MSNEFWRVVIIIIKLTRQMLVASWGEPEVQQLVHCITQTV